MVLEKYTCNRLIFEARGDQRLFLEAIKDVLKCNWADIADEADVDARTVRNWRLEKYRMPENAAARLAALSGIQLPENITLLEWRVHARQAGFAGAQVLMHKYGRVPVDENIRKQQWYKWWREKGRRQSQIIKPKDVSLPKKSEKLAEFIGIVLGDGSISKRQITITLHRFDDATYRRYVIKLIEDLFSLTPGQHIDKRALADQIVISRTTLVTYLVTDLGMKVGSKTTQQVDIPLWIKANDTYLRACVRGLVDTDGSVFSHRYFVNGKEYQYKKMTFTSASKPLRQSVFDYFQHIGLNPRHDRDKDVWLDSKASMHQYMKVVGFHNQKHLKRYNMKTITPSGQVA